MKYLKKSLSVSDQADLLIQRGMLVTSKQKLVDFLYKVNYYRFSGYCYIYKQVDSFTGEESFRPGTNLDAIINQYEFDRQLRLILMDAIDRIEITFFRTWLVELYCKQYGPFGYIDRRNFNSSFSIDDHRKLVEDIVEDESLSHEGFITSYRGKYIDEDYLPLWMAVEIMSFGQLFTFYKNIDQSLKKTMALRVRLFPPVLDSWLHTLNYVRNACAHHNRLWNKTLPIQPKFPDIKHDSSWYQPVNIDKSRIFAVLTLIRYILRFSDPNCNWCNELFELLSNSHNIPIGLMGFPKNWKELSLWK